MDETPVGPCSGWKLRHVVIPCYEGPSEGLESIVCASGPNLRKLDISMSRIPDDTLRVIGIHSPSYYCLITNFF